MEVGWTKSGAILNRKVNGKYWMYFLATNKLKQDLTGVAYSNDLMHWTEALNEPALGSRKGQFDERVAEPGPPPVITKNGILLYYNGADSKLVYRTGWALFDGQDPSKLLARSKSPILSPELDWERTGQVPNVVFVEGLVQAPGRWLFYYGGADKCIGMAFGKPAY